MKPEQLCPFCRRGVPEILKEHLCILRSPFRAQSVVGQIDFIELTGHITGKIPAAPVMHARAEGFDRIPAADHILPKALRIQLLPCTLFQKSGQLPELIRHIADALFVLILWNVHIILRYVIIL